MRFELPHPLAGRVPQVRPGIVMSGTPLSPSRPPPLLAQHTRDVLKERLKLVDADIEALAARGIVGLPR
jgi:crotonobetainyl-CoA:carnitine CoA-transferase CaiB-like acyl-CoA transferase